MNNSICVLMALLLAGVLFSSLSADTHYSIATGNWNAASTWSGTRGSSPGTSYPVAGDVVYIENEKSVTVNASGGCQTLYLGGQTGGTGNGTLVVNSGVTLTVGGNITNYGPNGNGFIQMIAGSIVQCGGSFTSPAGNTLTTNAGTFEYNGSSQNIYGTTYNNLSFSGSETKTLTGEITVNGNMTIGSGVTPALGSNTLNLNGNLSNSGNAMTGSGTVNIGGLVTQSIAGFTTSGSVSANNKSANVVAFTGNVSGTNLNVAAGTLNLGSGKSHTFSTLEVYATLDCGSSTMNLTLAGTATPITVDVAGGGTITMNTGTFNYSGAAQKIYATTYNKLTLSGTGGKTFPSGTTTVNGTLSIENGAYANTFNGTVAYGSSAVLNYNTIVARTTSAEWPASFPTGRVTISGTGKITTSGSKTMDSSSLIWVKQYAALEVASDLTVEGINVGGSVTFVNTPVVTVTDAVSFDLSGSWDGTGGGSFFLGSLSAYDGFTAGTPVYTFTGTGGRISNLGWSIIIPNMIVNGTITAGAGITVSTSLGGSGTLTTSAMNDFKIGGTCTIANFIATTSGSTVYYIGADQTIKSAGYYHLNLSGSGVKTVPAGISIAGNCTIGGTAEAVLNNDISVGGNLTVESGSTLTMGIYSANRSTSGGTLTVAGTLKIGGNNNFPANYSIFTASDGTVNYCASSVWQTVWPTTYNNLTLSGSGLKTNGETNVSGVLSMEGTATASDHPVSAGWLQYNTSTARSAGPEWVPMGVYTGGIIIANTGTITTNESKSGIASLTIRAGATLAVGSNYAFDVSGTTNVSGTFTLAGTGAKSFIGGVTLNSGGVWNETGAGSVTFGGNVTNNATTFTANTGVHQFGTGLGDYTIGGSAALSIPNVTFKYANYTNFGTLSSGTSLNIASGTLTQSRTGILNIGGTVSGTISAVNFFNTVNYYGASQTVLGINYDNLILSGSGTKAMQSGTTAITGNLSLSGAVTAVLVRDVTIHGNFNVGSGATLKTEQYRANNSGSGTLTVAGTIYVSGEANFPINYTSTSITGGTVIYNGSMLQYVSPQTYNNLTINNTSTDGMIWGGAVIVNGTLTLTDGLLATNSSNTLTLGPSGTISGGSSASYFNGPLSIQRTATGSHPDVYPIGKGGVYRPVTLTLSQSTSTLSTYTVEMISGAPTANYFGSSGLSNVSGVRYYKISEGSGGSVFTAGTVALNYDSDDLVSDYANLRVAQGPVAGGGTWANLAGSGTANTTGTITSTNAFTSLANPIFVLANAAGGTNALPVELVSFTAGAGRKNVELKWQTATEVNNAGFDVERIMDNGQLTMDNGQWTRDNGQWTRVAFVEGHGTTNAPQSYLFSDRPGTGKFQYRLKQIDRDGRFEYSSPVAAEIAAPVTFGLEQNYPNPFNPATQISFTLPVTGHARVTVMNILGETMEELFSGTAEGGKTADVSFDGSRLASGVYFCRMESGNTIEIRKMQLIR